MFNKIFGFILSLIYFGGTGYAVLAIVRMNLEDVWLSSSAGAFDKREIDVLKQRHYARTGLVFVFIALVFDFLNTFVRIKNLSMMGTFLVVIIFILTFVYIFFKNKYSNDIKELEKRRSMEKENQLSSHKLNFTEKNKEDERATEVFLFIQEMSVMRYEDEFRREDSLIRQSSQMQAAFSFLTAAIFMAVPMLLEYRGVIEIDFIFTSIFTITFFILISLVLASFAQYRYKYLTLSSIKYLDRAIKEQYESFKECNTRIQHKIDTLAEIQEKITEINDRRANFIRYSFFFFQGSIVLIMFWFIYAITLMNK